MVVNTLKFIQLNAHHCSEAHRELMQYIVSNDIDIALISEPFTKSHDVPTEKGISVFQFPSPNRTTKACIFIKENIGAALGISQFSTPNLSVVKLLLGQRALYIASAYVEPDNDQFNTLTTINAFISYTSTALQIIGGDFNGWHTSWGSVRNNARGVDVANIIAANGLEICNQGNTATFNAIRHGLHASSIVDVTLVSMSLLQRVSNWAVNVEAIQNSDHSAITFNIESNAQLIKAKITSTYLYNNKTANWEKFSKALEESLQHSGVLNTDFSNLHLNPTILDMIVEALTNDIKEACSKSMKLRGKAKQIAPWWNDELETLKKTCIKLHHDLNKLKKQLKSTTAAGVAHSKAKHLYASALKKASVEHFREFCTQQKKENVWSLTNRLIKDAPSRRPPVTLQCRGSFTGTSLGTAEALLQYFFPDDTNDSTRTHYNIRNSVKNTLETPDDLAFTEDEIIEALETMNPNRSPGCDNLTSDICLFFAKKYPKFITELYNACLRTGYFPRLWKQAYVKILQKSNKTELNDLGSYRPIGLLPVFGKLLEKLFTKRLIYHAEVHQLWSTKQYGFREQTSSIDALRHAIDNIGKQKRNNKQVICISLDIKAAFDHAWWPALQNQLERIKTPSNIYKLIRSYLADRKVFLNYAEASASKSMTRGCIQGSVCGPTFWNLILDELLLMPLPEGCEIQAFADDVLLTVSAKSVQELETYANDALRQVYKWGVGVKLTFSDSKTHAMAFTNRAHDAELTLNGTRLEFVNEMKFLGVIIDNRLRFTNHAKYVIAKVQRVFKNLCRFVRPTWGVHSENIITLYKQIVEPTVTYAASIWGKATQFYYIRRLLRSFQRNFAIRAIRAFHTVSATSALALAGFLPLHLKIAEAMKIENIKATGVYPHSSGNIQIEQRIPPKHQLHPSERQTIKYRSIVTQQQADNVPADNATFIYTDGSKLETGDCGAAFVIRLNGDWESHTFTLHKSCTVFQAEALAIDSALMWAQSELKTLRLCIFSDSHSCLDAIQNRSNPTPLIASIHQRLHHLRQGHLIDFFWVRSHIGIEGNEVADQHAKDATNQHSDLLYSASPLSYAKHQIQSEALEEWQREYEEEVTGSSTKMFFPTVADARQYRENIGISFELTQIFTGHGFNKAYLNRFKIISDDHCPCDSLSVQTMMHLLKDCPRYDCARERYKTFCVQHNVPPFDIKTVTKNATTTTEFSKYAKYIVNSLKNFNA